MPVKKSVFSYEDAADDVLISMSNNGDKLAADAIVRRYKPLVLKNVRTLFLLGGEKEDLIQEGMIALFGALGDYDASKGASFLTFAEMCIKRGLFHAMEKANSGKNSPLANYLPLDEYEGTVHGPEETVIERVNAADIDSELRSCLSPLEEQVWILYLAGYEQSEIAKKLDKSSKSIDNAMQRIKTKLKGCLAKHEQ